MTATINDDIWKSCEALAREKSLITIKNIKSKLLQLNYRISELVSIDQDITTIINKWRINKLNNFGEQKSEVDNSSFNIYKALAIPKKDDKNSNQRLQKKIFALEHELNKYKHTSCRANKKNKLLEKKLHTVLANIKRERKEFVDQIKAMLTN